MRFTIGDQTDVDQCAALGHEFLRCRDAFEEFRVFATISIFKGENRWLSHRMYNAYSAFITHLYEFIKGAHAREQQNTKITNKKLTREEKAKLDENYVLFHVQRLLTNRRAAIQNGTAPAWENDISHYPEEVPQNFVSEFREYRNRTQAHVNHERISGLNLSEFYEKYHKFLFLLYQDCAWWTPRGEEFPDLGDITKFSIVVKQHSGIQAHV
jgi:hypothetical protein